MDERVRRHWAAAEAQAYGWGGASAVSSATGMSRKMIRKGLAELGVRELEPDAPVTPRRRSPAVAAAGALSVLFTLGWSGSF